MSAPELSASALITIPEARRYVWRNEDDASRDGILVDAINDVSEAILDHLDDRELTPTDDVARQFRISRRGFIELAPYELRTIASLTLYADQDVANQKVLDADEYQLLPIGGTPEGTYWQIRAILPAISELQPGFGWVAEIDGDWGASAIPQTVKLACKQWVKNIADNPGSYASYSMSGHTITPDVDFAPNGAGMPAAVRHRLTRYRRGPFVA